MWATWWDFEVDVRLGTIWADKLWNSWNWTMDNGHRAMGNGHTFNTLFEHHCVFLRCDRMRKSSCNICCSWCSGSTQKLLLTNGRMGSLLLMALSKVARGIWFTNAEFWPPQQDAQYIQLEYRVSNNLVARNSLNFYSSRTCCCTRRPPESMVDLNSKWQAIPEGCANKPLGRCWGDPEP